MPRRGRTDWAAVDALIASRERVLTHTDLIALGVLKSTISRRIGPKGRWQRAAPGVVIAHRGTPTRRELVLAALAFAGEGAVISGDDAIHAFGGPKPALRDPIHVLVPETRQRKSFGQIRVERTRRLPEPAVRQGIPYALAARATVDAARHLARLDDVRDLISSGVQRRRFTVKDLQTEIRCAARQRTALGRAVLSEIGAGVRSVAEAKARRILEAAGLTPLWNVELLREDGSVLLSPDAYWPEFAAAIEIDSLAWHLDPASYRRTKARERLLIIHGVMVLAFTPQEILDDPEGFVAEVRRFLEVAAGRPLPQHLTWRVRSAA